MKLLHLDSSITGEGSVSRRLTAAIVAQLRKSHPGIDVAHRDLASAPLAHLTLARLPSADGEEARASEDTLGEFLAADIVVIGAPMYNFTIPSQLKAWLDRILIAGRTFAYDENGPRGLAGGKRVILAISRGGLYGAGTPAEALEHLETYLRGVFGFIGIVPEVVLAEGVNLGPDARESAIGRALDAASELKAA